MKSEPKYIHIRPGDILSWQSITKTCEFYITHVVKYELKVVCAYDYSEDGKPYGHSEVAFNANAEIAGYRYQKPNLYLGTDDTWEHTPET